MTSKKAACIREVENWSRYEAIHKLDSASFDVKKVKEALHVVAPKIEQILTNIEALDKKDMEKDGTMYKHLIYSELKAVGGAKSVAGALIAHGYSLIYNSQLQINDPIKKSPKNFALLSSSKLYQKDVGIRFRRQVLERFNERPDNIYGEKVRILVLDSGFKEGIDVFDIRYIHILETPITYADEKQVIGRGTRFCGQKGLKFDQEKGWVLHIYKYRTQIPEKLKAEYNVNYVYDLFIQYSDLNASLNNFAKDLEAKAIQSSVDLHTNKNLHITNPHFKAIYEEVEKLYPMEFNPIKVITRKYSQVMEKFGHFNCANGCKGKIMAMPVPFMLIVWYMGKSSTLIEEKRPKSFLCEKIVNSRDYCDRLNKAWANPDLYILKKQDAISKRLDKVFEKKLVHTQKEDMLNYVEKRMAALDLPPEPVTEKMTYSEIQAFIYAHFKKYIWDVPKIENLCVAKGGVGKAVRRKKSKRASVSEPELEPEPSTVSPAPVIKEDSASVAAATPVQLGFTPTQDFIRNYFQPASYYKGLLLWHSTGTGKTCTGIAAATSSFEKQGYTILWVTRNTLRGDVWKNMFGQVCSLVLREKMPDNFVFEEAMQRPLQFLSKNWMMPITYKQFSNLLLKRNKLYLDMVKRNGEEDPLKKTLIIIDEAHKLLSDDLNPMEKPDFGVLQRSIHHSYNVSKEDSVRLLLMSATPYTNNPMDFIKLINLLKHDDALPETFEEIKEIYLNEDGTIKTPRYVIERLSGYISYLNREQDIRQFAIPEIHTVDVPMSLSSVGKVFDDAKKYEDAYEAANMIVEKNKEAIRRGKEKLKLETKVLKDKCRALRVKADKAKCLEGLDDKVAEFKKYLFDDATELVTKNEAIKIKLKGQIRDLKSSIKNANESDMSQEKALRERCFN